VRIVHSTALDIDKLIAQRVAEQVELRIAEEVELRLTEQVNVLLQKHAFTVGQALATAARLQSSAIHESADVAATDEMLTAIQIGQKLGVSDETVRQRELQGEIFAVLQPGRKRGRQYPAFQLWPGVAGEPLKRVLAHLGFGGASAYQFFTSPNADLASLSPLQVLSQRALTLMEGDSAKELLALADGERLSAVERAAAAFAASLEA
jgi:hypothetical protein